jgi:glycerol-3-phosphate dehydrogenase
VNAAGPWVENVIGRVVGAQTRAKVRLVQGSHVVVRRLYEHDRCYFFQNTDGRIFFAIPYEDDFTLIGTTDRDYVGAAEDVRASEAEIAYLIEAANSYFRATLARSQVVWSYSGVRPLYDDGSSAAKDATRDYVLATAEGAPGLLNVFGGKITTYRRLAEDVLEKLAPLLPAASRNFGWTARSALPGGDFPPTGAEALALELAREYPFLTRRETRRYVRHYGTETHALLGGARRRDDLGHAFGGDLTEAEVCFLMTREFARAARDIVWRRTKSGLRMQAPEIAALDEWMARRSKTRTAATA